MQGEKTMASTLKEFFRVSSSKEGLDGFILAVWLIMVILTSFSWVLGIELHGQSNTYWAKTDPTRLAFGIPSYDNPSDYKLYITSIGEHAGSISIIAQQVNGWNYNGTFFLGDTISLGTYRVEIKSINLDRANPIELQYYQVTDLKPFLLAVSIILTVLLYFRIASLGKRKKKKQEKNETEKKE